MSEHRRWTRRRLGVAIAAIDALALLLAGCRATPPDSVLVDIRNVSPGAITITTVAPGPFLFANTVRYTIQPWAKGRCFAHIGLDPGHVEIRVSGSNVGVERAYSMTTPVPVSVAIHVGIQVLANGEVQFGGPFPPDPSPCEGGGY